MTNPEAPAIVRAVLEGNVEKLAICLAQGESPNQVWGTLPLVTHAALLPSLPIFRLLTEHGARVSEGFLYDVITWELGDWRITSNEREKELVGILKAIRGINVWPPEHQRRELAARLEGYGLTKLTEILLAS